MKTNYLKYGLMTAMCVPALELPLCAQVSESDFNALKAAVQQLSDQMAGLQATNKLQQQIHAQDVQKIQALEDKLSRTQQTAEDAVQKSIAVAQTQAQPPPRPPIDEATVNHNFQIVGDAEFRYSKIDNQYGAF